MESDKLLKFEGTAGGYFLVFLVILVASYIPFFGWAFAFNFMASWMTDNTKVNGKTVAYTAGYGETLGFIFVNFLLLLVTLGIYTFWFVPKVYRYIMDHISYPGETSAPVATAPTPEEAPAAPEAPTPPVVQ